MKTQKKKPTKKKEEPKIIAFADSEPIESDSNRLHLLRERMTPSDRQNYDYICDAIKISLDTGRLSVFPQLVKQKEEIERRYEQSDDEAINITWDDTALSEAGIA